MQQPYLNTHCLRLSHHFQDYSHQVLTCFYQHSIRLKYKRDLKQMSLGVRKPKIWVLSRSDTNRAVQSQKMVRGLKFWIKKVEELYFPCSKNKGADQLCSYCEVDLRLCFRLCRLLVFHAAAQILLYLQEINVKPGISTLF